MITAFKTLISSKAPTGKRFLYWLIGGLAVCNLIVGYSFFSGLGQQKADTTARAAMSAQNLVQAISQSIANSAQKLDDSLQSTVFALERQLRSRQHIDPEAIGVLLAEQRTFHIETLPWIITDASGKPVYIEGNPTPPAISLAEQPYFQLLSSGRQKAYVRLTDISHFDAPGLQVILSARAYTNPDGSFAGVVIAPVQLSYFRNFLKGFRMPEGGLLSIYTDRNVLIALRADGAIGEKDRVGSLLIMPEEYLRLQRQGVTSATYGAITPTDGVARLFSFQYVAQTPLVVAVGLTDAYYLKNWYEIVRLRIAVFAILLVISVILSLILYWIWRKQAGYASELRHNNAQLRALLKLGEVSLCELDFTTGRWISSAEQELIFGIDADYPRTIEGWTRLVHPEDVDFLTGEGLRDTRAHATNFEYEYRIIRPADGKTRWVQVRGQYEYLPDSRPARLFGAIKDVTSLRESQHHISHLVYHDDLTGMPNRVLLTERLQQAMLRTRRRGGTLVLCSLDLDGFKPVNDQWGHFVGDRLLIEVASRLTRCLRDEDTVARLGGDEFVLLMGGMEEAAQINGALERIRTALAEPFTVANARITITVSIGATAFPRDNAADADTMLRHADQAMHEAKHAGKNGVCWFDPETDRLITENRIQYERLEQALKNREFVLHYQPTVDLHADVVTGAEALIRWMHPEEGLLPPARFLPIIENTELCIPLGEWVIREALDQHRRWLQEGIDLKICINIFPHHLQQSDFSRRLAQILVDFPHLAAGRVNLEVLETSLLKDLTDISRRIRECSALGVDFSLDDFGTGYSSLSYFSRLPVKTVKIDQSFTRGILSSPADLALIESLVSLSHSIGREVVAEGVETTEHALPLIACGCDIAQGYGIARPMPGGQFVAWAKNWRRPEAWRQKA